MDKGKHHNDRVEEHFKYSSPIPKSHLTNFSFLEKREIQ